MLSRRKFLGGAAALGAVLGMGAKPPPKKEKMTMGYLRTGSFVTFAPTSGVAAAWNSATTHITVPAGESWQVLSIFVTLLTSATAGNRAMEVIFRDPSAFIFARLTWSGTVAASLTRYMTTNAALAAVQVQAVTPTVTVITEPFVGIILPAGYSMEFQDASAVDAAADTVALFCQYDKYQYTSDIAQTIILNQTPTPVVNPFT